MLLCGIQDMGFYALFCSSFLNSFLHAFMPSFKAIAPSEFPSVTIPIFKYAKPLFQDHENEK